MWLKADLHVHTCEGPEGLVHWTPLDLVDLAAQAGYKVLSFTDHDTQTYNPTLARYAHNRGIVLIPGVEATVERRHVLLYNFPCAPEALRSFSDIRRHKGPHSLVIAPHPFFPGPTSLRWRLLEHLDLFDAAEYSHFYSTWIDYNRRILPMARGYDLPLVGSSDAHLPCQFGTTYSLIDADPKPEAVIEAIRCGRVRVVSRPLTSSALCAIGLVLACGAMLRPKSWLLRAIQDCLGVTTVGTSTEAMALRWPGGESAFARAERHRPPGGFVFLAGQPHSTGQD